MTPLSVYQEYLDSRKDSLSNPSLNAEQDIRLYMSLRLLLLFSVLMTVVWLQVREVVDPIVLNKSYILTGFTFALTAALILLYEKAAQFKYFLSSQIAYDVFFTTALVFYTGPFDSLYTIFYMFNVIFAAILFRSRGALVTAILCGALYTLLNVFNQASSNTERSYSILTVVTALLAVSLLSGKLFDELRSSRQQIGRLEALNEEIIDSLDSGLVAVDQSGKIERVNRTAAHLFDIQNTEGMRGKDFTESFPDLSKMNVDTIVDMRVADRPRRFWLSKVELPEGRVMYLIRDLSEVLDLEEKLRRQERLAAVGRLAAGIAHEVRNPVASISGAAQLLSASKQSLLSAEESVRLTDLIVRESERVDRLIAQLLRFSKPSEMPREKFELSEVLREVSESAEARPEFKGKVQIDTDLERSILINGYRDQWNEVLTNLIVNAAQAGARRIKVLLRKRGASAELMVQDDGAGIPSDIRSRIFDPFFTTKADGTGLGLAHVYRVVREHEGQIDVLSPNDRGTEMRIQVPMAA